MSADEFRTNKQDTDVQELTATHVMQSPPGPEVTIDGRRYLYFSGTGYLGLQSDPELINALCDAARQFGVGSATSREPLGTTQPLIDLEQAAADWLGTESAFYLASGYLAAQAIVSVIHERYDAIVLDQAAHYSLLDAAQCAGLPVHRFEHCDPDSLRRTLSKQLMPGDCPLLMTDGVFAVTGRIAPLAAYYEALESLDRHAGLLVDDAHGIGVLGPTGRGSLEHAGLAINDSVSDKDAFTPEGERIAVYQVATLSKAIGGYGGIVPCSHSMFQEIRARSPLYNAASPVPTPITAATARALQIVASRPELLTSLRANVEQLRELLREVGLPVERSPVPIIGLELGDASNMRRVQRELEARGVMIAYIPSYSGVGPDGLLRISVTASHTPEMIRRLVDELRRVL